MKKIASLCGVKKSKQRKQSNKLKYAWRNEWGGKREKMKRR